MRKPIFEIVVGHLLRPAIVSARAVRGHAPDIPAAATIGVEIDPLSVPRIIRAVVVRGIEGESFLLPTSRRHAVEVVLLAVAVGDERQILAVRRPPVEAAGPGGDDETSTRAI